MVFDREASLERLAERTAEAAAAGAELVVFPEAYCLSIRPRSGPVPRRLGRPAREGRFRPARRAVGRGPGPRRRPARRGGAGERRLARHGVTEIDPERPGTLYNTLLYHDLDGRLRITGSSSLRTTSAWSGARETGAASGRSKRRSAARRAHLLGELHAARALRALRVGHRDLRRLDRGRLRRLAGDARAPGASRGPSWSRLATSSERRPIRDFLRGGPRRIELVGRGGARSSARTAPTSPDRSTARRGSSTRSSTARLHEERQRFDPAGHYHRPDVLKLRVDGPPEA